MPELPDLEAYLHALRPRAVGRRLDAIRLASPFFLRSVTPPPAAAAGRRLEAVSRLGKRLVFHLEGDLFLVLHLMIAGRLRWRAPRKPIPKRLGLAALDFGGENDGGGTLLVTEAGSKKRAALHLAAGLAGLAAHDPGGLEVLTASREVFAQTLVRESHTLKRALTDPHLFAGIGNAYSDEILHRARLSPFALTRGLGEPEVEALDQACRAVLTEWRDRLVAEAGEGFPDQVTAFREGMAVHGRFGRPCPVCGSPVQRLVYAENEANYCPGCQTGGRLLADRALSRLLKGDWPRTLEELERRKSARAAVPQPTTVR